MESNPLQYTSLNSTTIERDMIKLCELNILKWNDHWKKLMNFELDFEKFSFKSNEPSQISIKRSM